MGFWSRLFGGASSPPGASNATSAGSAPRDSRRSNPKQLAQWYREGLQYLDQCGTLDETKLRELNGIIGGVLTEADIKNFVAQSRLILPSKTSGGGMDAVKEMLRNTLQDGVATFGSMG